MSKQINWYPGHMYRSEKEIKENLKLVDIIFVILDARIPYSSFNPNLKKIIGNKPTLLLFNKMDYADINNLNKWKVYYEEKGYYTLAIDSITKKNFNKIYPLVKTTILKKHVDKLIKQKRELIPFKTMVLGIPNVGKSTFINAICGQKQAKVENRPGVTRNLNWFRISNQFDLLDTPGLLWPKFSNDCKYNLALTGSIKDDILPLDDIVKYGINYLLKHYPDKLKKRYNLSDINLSYIDVLNEIGKKRGALIKGGNIDYERVYYIFLKDLRANKFGGISFESP